MRKAAILKIACYVLSGMGLFAQTRLDLGRQGRNPDFSQAQQTRPFRSGNALPASCQPGEVFLKADGAWGRNVYVCGPANAWSVIGEELPSAGMAPGKVLAAGEGTTVWKDMGGDVIGAPDQLQVVGLRGRPVSAVAPNGGDVLTWDSAAGAWQPGMPVGQYEAGEGVTIAGRSLAVDGATVPSYSTGEGAPTGQCEPGRDYYLDLSGQEMYVCTSANTWTALSWRLHSHAWGALTGNLDDQADLRTALASKADVGHSHVLGGDLEGNVGAATVIKLQNRAVAPNPPSDGQVLVWRSANQRWEPGSAGGSFDPLDEITVWYRENFPNTATGSGSIGAYGWTSSCTGGSISHTGTGNGGKAVRMTTGTTSGNYCTIYLGSVATSDALLGKIGAYASWDSVFRFRLNGTGAVKLFIGYLKGGIVDPWSGERIGLEFDTTQGDTQFMFVTVSGGTTRQASGVTADTGWHKLRIRSETSGVITFTLDDGSDVSVSTNVSTTRAFNPIFFLSTQEAAAKSADALRWYWRGPDVR